MKLLALLPLLGLTLGYTLPINNQFTHKFTSQVLTGIPELNSQYAGLRLLGKVVSQVQSDNTVKIQLLDTKYKTYNEILNLSEEGEIIGNDEMDVPADIKLHLEAPFVIVLGKNLEFEKIIVNSEEPVFVANLKKSLLAEAPQIYYDQAPSMLDTNSIQRTPKEQEKVAFTNTEKTLAGECEVQYNINKLPEAMAIEFEEKEANPEAAKLCQGKAYYEVLRTRNYQSCVGRPIIQHSYGLSAKSDGSMGATSPVVTESFVQRTIFCGPMQSHFLRKNTVESKKMTSAHGDVESKEKIVVTTRKTFVLSSIDNITSPIEDIVNPITLDTPFEYPLDNYWTSKVSEQGTHPITNGFMPIPMEENKNQEVFVEKFVKFVELSKQSPESAVEDVNRELLILTKQALLFSYEDIKDVWAMIKQNIHHDIAHKESAQHVFLDILSIGATNPCVKYISEIVKNEIIVGEPAAWLVANLIKSVKLPTEELIQELTNLLQHTVVQSSNALKSTIAMGLTELVYKACIDETASVNDYPSGVYELCSKDSTVIRKVLLPFLVERLEEQKYQLQQDQPATAAMNSALIYINALGNLGLLEASYPLLDIIEGKLTTHAHLRSVAVYKLIRFARNNPSVYRPVILAIIQNIAENEEVRMAAVTVLPYTLPSALDMQKLATRTWFEPSQQVASYITTTLRSLKDLPLQAPLYDKIAQKAETAYKFAKPVATGIQTSHNIKIVEFLDTLRAAVSLKLQYVNSEESAIPRTMYVKSDVQTKSHTMEMMDSAVYIQGSEVLIEKMYNLYQKMQGQEISVQQHESVLNIKNRMTKQPEAHVTLNMLGLQRFYSIDSQLIQGIIHQLTNEFQKDSHSRGITKDFLKVLDVHGYTNVIPTELGIPLYIQHRTPVVISSHASLIMINSGEVEIKIKPVVNYKQWTSVGIFCPFTKQSLGAGVDTSVHVAIPLRADVAMQHGQLSVTLKTPQDFESQKVKPVVQFQVMPYTGTKGTMMNMFSEMKTIRSQHNEKKSMEVQLGEKLGVDLKFMMESEHKFTDLANFLQGLSHHQPLTLLSLPLPPMSVARHSLSLVYNPLTSLTKQASFVMSLGHGTKASLSEKPVMIYPSYQVDQEIETQCQEEQECMKMLFCNKEERMCLTEMRKQNRPTSEINKYCSIKFSQCNQRHILRQNVRSVLSKLESGSAVTFNIIASLLGEHESTIKEVETHLTVGHKPAQFKSAEKSETHISASFKFAPDATPFELDINALSFVDKPIYAWTKTAIIDQDLKAGIWLKAELGIQGQKKMPVMSVKVDASQSEDQKMFAVTSEVAKQCVSDMTEGQISSPACKHARTHASSLDVVETIVDIPSFVSQNPMMVSFGELVKLYYLPYMTITQVQPQGVTDMERIVLKAKIDPQGQKMTLNVQNTAENIEIRDLRIAPMLQGLLPISTKGTLIHNVVQQLTLHGAPSVCSVQGGKVTTFDKLVYDYQVNDCEHVVFKDCSPANIVEVSVKKAYHTHHVKVVLANIKYELELPKTSFRGSVPVIRVNGEEKTIQQGHLGKQHEQHTFVELEENYYVDANTYLTSFKDGVYALVNKLYGIVVVADGDSLEVETFQHSLRNQVCGLCGDLNDEKTADMKSAGMCIMSSPKLAAYSYMVPDNKCAGIPKAHLAQFQAETDRCVKKELIPTKVTEVFKQKKVISMKHLVEESINKVCISKMQINICGASTVPKEVIMKEVPFFCVPKDTAGATMMRIAENGEKIQNVQEYPTIFVKKVSQPIRC